MRLNIKWQETVQFIFISAALVLIALAGFDNFFAGSDANRTPDYINFIKLNQATLAAIAFISGFITVYINKDKLGIKENNEQKDKEVWGNTFPVVLLVLIGFIIRIWNLGKLSLWSDEGTVYIAVNNILQSGLPYLETGFLYLRDLPHLYLTALSVYIFGHTEFALRLPSVIAGTLLIIFVYLLGKEIYSKKIALFAGLIVAIHPWMIEYSRISRSYILMVFFLTASYYYLTKYIKDKKINHLIPFGVLAVLASLTHQIGQIILLTIIPVVVLLLGQEKCSLRNKIGNIAKNLIFYLIIVLSIIVNKFLYKKGFYFVAEQRINAGNDPLKYIPFGALNFDNLKILITILPEYWIFAAIALISGIVFIKKLSIKQKLLNGTLLTFIIAVNVSIKDVTINRSVLFLFPFIVLISGAWLALLYRVTKKKTEKIVSTAILFSIILIYLPASLKITRAEYGDPINPYYSAFEGFIFRQDNKTTYQYVNKHYKDGDIIMVYGVERYAALYSKYPVNYRVWSSPTTSTLNKINLYSGVKEVSKWWEVRKILNKEKRIWLITTYSIFSETEMAPRISHINQALINLLSNRKDKIVYQGKDPSASVYLIEN